MMKKFITPLLFLSVITPLFAGEPHMDEYWLIPVYDDDTGIDWSNFNTGYYDLDGSTKNNASALNPGDWRVFNDIETEVLGTSTCNQNTPEQTIMNAAEMLGKNCWCKILATTNDIHKTTPTKWIYRGEFKNTAECSKLCTYRCTYNFVGDEDFRGEIFNK